MEDRQIPRGIATPDVGPVEVHFDGACEGGRGGSIATYGFTVAGTGLQIEDRGLAVPPFHERATNNVAEYVGAICALESLVRAGYAGEVTVRGDSQLVIRQMSGEYEVRADHLRPYHQRLKQLAALFPRVEFHWVPREENLRADELSKAALAEARAELRRVVSRPSRWNARPGQSDGDDPGWPQRTV